MDFRFEVVTLVVILLFCTVVSSDLSCLEEKLADEFISNQVEKLHDKIESALGEEYSYIVAATYKTRKTFYGVTYYLVRLLGGNRRSVTGYLHLLFGHGWDRKPHQEYLTIVKVRMVDYSDSPMEFPDGLEDIGKPT